MERHYILIVNVVEMVVAVEPTVKGFFLISRTTGLNTKTVKNARAQVKALLPKSALAQPIIQYYLSLVLKQNTRFFKLPSQLSKLIIWNL